MGKLLQRQWTPSFEPGLPRRARKGCAYESYVPERLGDIALTIAAEVAADVADAERQIASLPTHGSGLATIEALSRFLLRAEAVASSRIEGLEVGARRLAHAEIARREGWQIDDQTAKDVIGNVAAVRSAIEHGGRAEALAVEDLHALHRTLLADDRRFPVGAPRQVQNWIGGSPYNPCGAAFVPPPADMVADLLTDLAAYVNRDDHPPVVQAALAHAQFETIHPYVDGNGRVGRALIHIVLGRRGLVAGSVLPISLALATRQDEYIAGLTAYGFVGDWGSSDADEAVATWLEIFAAACRRAVDDARWLMAEYDELIGRYQSALGPIRRHSTVAQLLARLGELPVLTVELAAEHLGRSFEASNNAIARLVEIGALRQSTAGRRNRVFEAIELLELVTNAERRMASREADTRVSPPARRVPHRPT
jgi:Fic family protein